MIAAYFIFGLVVLLTIVIAIGVTKFYQDPDETQPLSTIVTVTSFTLLLLTLFIIPIDIYNISRDVEPGIKREARDTLGQLYEAIYILLLANSFVIVPFAYFYHEEEDLESTIQSKLCGAIKYTGVFMVVFVALMVAGLFVRDKLVHKDTSNLKWVTEVLQDQHEAMSAVSFTVACFTAIGVCLWVVYTGYGLGSVGLKLFNSSSPLVEREQLEADQELLIEQTRSIQSKYALTGRNISARDRLELERLRERERLVKRRANRLDSQYDNFVAKVRVFLAPFGKLLGLIIFAVSALLWGSWLLGELDRIENSACGISCGFLIQQSTIFNPMDWILLESSRIFPLDYVLLIIVVLFIFAVSLYGIFSMGVRVLWVLLYRISWRASSPQGLLLVASYMTLIMFALTAQLTTLAPQYTTFGTQKFTPSSDKDEEFCSNAVTGGSGPAKEACVHSQVSLLVLQMISRSQFFGGFFFIANWLFLISSLLASGFACFRRSQGLSLSISEYDQAAGYGDDDDDF